MMGNYSSNAQWNDKAELACLIIFKKLENEGFPRGKRADLIRQARKIHGNLPEENSMSAKISNFMSVAEVNKHSKASSNTRNIYKKYKNHTVAELEKIYENCNFDDGLLK